jgi:phosphopentomutase
MPHLRRLGLGRAAAIAAGRVPPGLDTVGPAEGAFGAAAEVSRGKDTPSGHWEIAGVPVDFDWGYFPRSDPCFPAALTDALVREGNVPGILGNRHASGTAILADLGEASIATGKPICYTSADSVFQIAAHEHHFGLDRLYALCETAKTLLEPYNIGRVIARPFVGESADSFKRTGKRRDLTTPPPAETLLDRVIASGGTVVSIGKIADIFARRGISRERKAPDNAALFDALVEEASTAPDGSLVLVNFVDFDMLYGHRRDVAGYAAALEAFDGRLPSFERMLGPGDLALITADHGCDPTWTGSDHTREYVPVLFFGPGIGPANSGRHLGARAGFADMGQTVARHLGLAPLRRGRDCLD